ncbi:MAG: UDP-N-acetylmuramoyl-tripeptide--D-alanyl-D-alanine ligase [Microcoleaceae cyanobacterium]
MHHPITLLQVSNCLSATTFSLQKPFLDTQIVGVTTDTRTLKSGEVFVALKGERFDGHQFVEAALSNGASCAVVETEFARAYREWPLLAVDDPLMAYQKIASMWRHQFSIPIIGVTGSVGKTTTKELIATVLSTQGQVHKTQANYNNEIGVPKTLLQLTENHDYAVVEMAMRGPGEIAELTRITDPTIGLITNVGTAHIGRLGSEDAIARAKCELLAEMSSESTAILNADNQRLIKTAAKVWSGQTLTYGLEQGDLRGELIDAETLRVEGVDLPLPLPGAHNASNFLAALAVLKVLSSPDLSPQERYAPLISGVTVELPAGRAKKYQLPGDILILDETYNAGLESMIAALKLLKQTSAQRFIAVLGTMKELGERSPEFHHQVGQMAHELDLDALFILAEPLEAKAMAEGAVGLSQIETIDVNSEMAHQKLARMLTAFAQPGDCFLFKASHSVELNRVVDDLRTTLGHE